MAKKDETVSRRNFLKMTGGAAVAAGAMAGGIVLNPGTIQAASVPKKWDEEYDVIVFGTGFAGLAAAIEAAQAGAKTVVYEKMKLMGGNSSINGGVMAIAGSDVQKQKGIKDSPDRLMADMLKAGLGLNHVDLAKIVATESVKTYEWLKSELKVEFQAKPPLIQMGGHSVPRSRIIKGNTGAGIVNKELAKLKEMGVPVKKRVCLTALIQDDTGRVVGATVREGYSFPDANSGTVKNIKAKKGVIMATGGFSRDMFLRTAQDPRLVASVDSTNQPGATGEGLMSMMGCGATPVQLSWIQLGPWASPEEKGFGMAPHFSTQAFLYGILVNPKTGKRFVNELADRKTRADAILATDNICVVFATAEKMKDGGVVDALLPRMLKKGVAKKYETLGELAAAYKIPADALKAEVAKYNGFLKAGQDDEFGKPFPKDAAPIESGPFLAVRLWPKVHHTMGGALINENAQVIGLDDKPISGLYAAGEVTGGIHGACRLGSVATLECLVFGRRAGRNAAKSA